MDGAASDRWGITRRALLRAAAIGGAALALPLRLPTRVLAAPRPSFFTRAERRTLEALCDRILPPDRDPGAKDLGAVHYVETLLTAFDGDPPLLYAGGPFSGRTPFADRRGRRSERSPENAFRRPLALTRLQELFWRAELFGSDAAGLPAALVAQRGGPFEGLRDVYRQGLTGVDALARARGGKPFRALAVAEQDDLLAALDGPDAIDFPGRRESFLDVVIRHVLEGCFAAPEYGGNRGGRGWRMIGIEGDAQPLGYSVFSEMAVGYRERRHHPMSTPNPDDLRGGSLAPRPLSEDGLSIQDTIADLAEFLGGVVPGELQLTTGAADAVLGNRALARFDACVIGSGAGGGTAACVLAEAGWNVLVLEAGPNPFPGLDEPGEIPLSDHSSDELKYSVRGWLGPQGLLEPRTFRTSADATAALQEDVNALPKAVGGAFQHADCKTPRFNAVDFRLRSEVEALIGATPGLAVPGFGAAADGASFADWPFGYEELEPFYGEAELLYGVQGTDDDPFASPRSTPYPMPPGVPMYLGLLLSDAARRTPLAGAMLHPHTYPASINSRPYAGRPACVDCGFCSGFGCPSHAKGSPAVTALRRAFATGRCQLRYGCQVVRLENDGGHVSAAVYQDADGNEQSVAADRFLLAASAIESARLCLLSETPLDGALGNASGLVGAHLTFHHQTVVSGFLPQRVHGQRGRAVSHGLSDFRGVEPGGAALRVFQTDDGPRLYLGGIVEFGAPQGLPITEDGMVFAFQLPSGGARFGRRLKNAVRDAALSQHLVALIMQGEDAPQAENRIDLDPTVRDVFGLPVARVTYRPHAFELEARRFYVPVMRQILENAGCRRVFTAPCETLLGDPPTSRHLMGTLRMGEDPATSVVDPQGRFHDVDNLWACDGSVFPTSSGYNPTLTLIAVALRIAHALAGA